MRSLSFIAASDRDNTTRSTVAVASPAGLVRSSRSSEYYAAREPCDCQHSQSTNPYHSRSPIQQLVQSFVPHRMPTELQSPPNAMTHHLKCDAWRSWVFRCDPSRPNRKAVRAACFYLKASQWGLPCAFPMQVFETRPSLPLTSICHGECWGVGMNAATTPSTIKITPLAKRVIAWKTLLDLVTSQSFPPRHPNIEFVKNPAQQRRSQTSGFACLSNRLSGLRTAARKPRRIVPSLD